MRKLARLFHYWAYSLIFAPFITDWLERGHIPHMPREYITEVVLGIIIAGCVSWIYRDIKRLKEMVETDVLTGLYNRRKFSENLQREVIRSNRLKTPLTMLYIDVDDFKSINDTHGHTEGDLVLRNVANMLLETGRHQLDTFYRLGGDEFAAVLPGASEEDAAGIIQRAEQNCRQNHDYLQQLNVSLSFGIAALEEGESADQLIKRADDKMYTSKSKRSSVGEHSSVMILRPDSSTSVSVKTHH